MPPQRPPQEPPHCAPPPPFGKLKVAEALVGVEGPGVEEQELPLLLLTMTQQPEALALLLLPIFLLLGEAGAAERAAMSAAERAAAALTAAALAAVVGDSGGFTPRPLAAHTLILAGRVGSGESTGVGAGALIARWSPCDGEEKEGTVAALRPPPNAAAGILGDGGGGGTFLSAGGGELPADDIVANMGERREEWTRMDLPRRRKQKKLGNGRR